jgi:hypothetical protein
LLAWFKETLARHEPDEAVSLLEAQARFIAVLTGLIAVERGGGMLFGWTLSGEHADALMRAALPALTNTVQAWRAHLERRYGAHGQKEVARIAAELRYAPLLDRGPLRLDASVEEALARLIDACLDPRHAAPHADERLGPTLRSALSQARTAFSEPRAGWSVAVKLPLGDRRLEVAEAEALHGAFHPQVEALYASIDGLALLPSASAPSRLRWPSEPPPEAIILVSPLKQVSVIRKSSSAMEQEQRLITFAGLPGHMLRTEKEFERGVEHEYVEVLYLALRAGTAEVYLTDTRYSTPPRLLAADLVSFLHALRGAASQVDNVLAALAKGFNA